MVGRQVSYRPLRCSSLGVQMYRILICNKIKNSKFIVVDLTHQNNGAYFEEGYAMGLGKPVIQLCKKDVKLHFDIAQKNTIFWTTEDEITDRLPKRILATIE